MSLIRRYRLIKEAAERGDYSGLVEFYSGLTREDEGLNRRDFRRILNGSCALVDGKERGVALLRVDVGAVHDYTADREEYEQGVQLMTGVINAARDVCRAHFPVSTRWGIFELAILDGDTNRDEFQVNLAATVEDAFHTVVPEGLRTALGGTLQLTDIHAGGCIVRGGAATGDMALEWASSYKKQAAERGGKGICVEGQYKDVYF